VANGSPHRSWASDRGDYRLQLGLGRPPEDGSVEPACNDWLGPIAATSWPANSVIRYWRAQYKDDRRKGEITHGDLKRRWPDPVALPSEEVRGVRNSEVIFCAADVVSATPLAHSLRAMTANFVVLCFSPSLKTPRLLLTLRWKAVGSEQPAATVKTSGPRERVAGMRPSLPVEASAFWALVVQPKWSKSR
jgi:hypothetical protein